MENIKFRDPSSLTAEEVERYIYEPIYRYFDMLVSAKELTEELRQNGLLAFDFKTIKTLFLENCSNHARKYHGIESLEEHIYKMKLLTYVLDLYEGLLNNTIKPGEYYAGVEKLDLDINTFTPIVKDCCVHHNIEVDPNVKSLPFIKAFDQIYKETDEEKVYQVLNEYARFEENGSVYAGTKLHSLILKCRFYVELRGSSSPKADAKILEDNVKKVIERNNEIGKKVRQQANLESREETFKQSILASSHIIVDYINGDELLNLYLTKNGIAKADFLKLVKYTEEYDPKLYADYQSRLEKDNKIALEYRDGKVATLAGYILKGVEEKHKIRKFELLDFYQRTKRDETLRHEFVSLVLTGNYSTDEKNKIKQFFGIKSGKFVPKEKDCEDEVLKMELTLPTGKVSYKRKKNVVDYLHSIGVEEIPRKLFSQAVNRYVNGDLKIKIRKNK